MNKLQKKLADNSQALSKLLISSLAATLMICPSAWAADHNEAPGIMGAEGSQVDITDIFAFKSPTNPNNLVLALGVFSPVAGEGLPLFSDSARYELYVDTNGDDVADSTVRATFSTSADGQQSFSVRGVPGVTGLITGAVSTGETATIAERSQAKAFAGIRDDHFYFDNAAFRNFTSAPCIPTAGLRCPGTGDPTNFFGTFNTATIVVEFPTAALPNISSADSGNLSVWGKTFSNQIQ